MRHQAALTFIFSCADGKQPFPPWRVQDQKLCFINTYIVYMSYLGFTKPFFSRICLKILDIVILEK